MKESLDGFGEDVGGTEDEYGCADECSEEGKPAVAVREPGIAFLERLSFEEPGGAEGEAIAEVMDGIGENGGAIGPDAAEDLDDGEYEGRFG